ncbi:MAG TPA: hypothetical protein VL202_00310 [Pararhizobium sp.]|uniref:hypothetical protein n=1 Tax=Pararhizobium sp. TaxID=1977563 RepID=UPI002BA382BE|nr:hypothetical protein [Pararhizobium sp.]HTO29612.1 hypothetical protein [Pararhizobium sp.]
MNLTPDELVAIHAEQRAKERYAIKLSEIDREQMVDQVKSARGLFFKKKDGSSKVSIWLVWWTAAARIVPIYYKSGRVLTVLPTDAFFGPPEATPTNQAKKLTFDIESYATQETAVYADWLRGGNTTGGLSDHALAGLQSHIARIVQHVLSVAPAPADSLEGGR